MQREMLMSASWTPRSIAAHEAHVASAVRLEQQARGRYQRAEAAAAERGSQAALARCSTALDKLRAAEAHTAHARTLLANRGWWAVRAAAFLNIFNRAEGRGKGDKGKGKGKNDAVGESTSSSSSSSSISSHPWETSDGDELPLGAG